ncbi:uncharacterized [Tachysurus ichikawai]
MYVGGWRGESITSCQEVLAIKLPTKQKAPGCVVHSEPICSMERTLQHGGSICPGKKRQVEYISGAQETLFSVLKTKSACSLPSPRHLKFGAVKFTSQSPVAVSSNVSSHLHPDSSIIIPSITASTIQPIHQVLPNGHAAKIDFLNKRMQIFEQAWYI